MMVTAIVGKDGYKTELITTGHTLIADEPLADGGTDLGPAPEQYLQLSLAACTAITLRMYANRKEMPLEKVKVEVSLEKFPDKSVFTRNVYLEGALDDAQRERLLKIANACPVHKILTHPIEVETSLK